MKDMLKGWQEKNDSGAGTTALKSAETKNVSVDVLARRRGMMSTGSSVSKMRRMVPSSQSAMTELWSAPGGLKHPVVKHPAVFDVAGVSSRGCGCGAPSCSCVDDVLAMKLPSSMGSTVASRQDGKWLDAIIVKIRDASDPHFSSTEVATAAEYAQNPDAFQSAIQQSEILSHGSVIELLTLVERLGGIATQRAGKSAASGLFVKAAYFLRSGPAGLGENTSGCDALERFVNEWEEELNRSFPRGGNGLRDLYSRCMLESPEMFCEELRQANNHCNGLDPDECNRTSAAARNCERRLGEARSSYCGSLWRPFDQGGQTWPPVSSILGHGLASGAAAAYWRALHTIAQARDAVRRCRLSGRTPGPLVGPMADVDPVDVFCLVGAVLITVLIAVSVFGASEGGVWGFIAALVVAAILAGVFTAICYNQSVRRPG